MPDPAGFEQLLAERLARRELTVIIARRPCLLAAGDISRYEKAAAETLRRCTATSEVEHG